MDIKSSREFDRLKKEVSKLRDQLEEAKQENEYLDAIVNKKLLEEQEHPFSHTANIFTILTNNINSICWVANQDGFLFVSDAYERIFESSIDELYVSSSVYLLYTHPDDMDRVNRINRRLFRFEDLVRFQHRIITPTGKTKSLDTQIIPSFDEEYGKLIVGISSDTTDIYEQQKQLEEAKNKAEESDRLKSAFLANMSHEIRTPLNGIIGFTELFMDPTLSTNEKTGFTEIIKDCSEQLMSTITEVLELSQIKAKQVKIEPIETNVNSVLIDVFNILQGRAKRNGINFKIAESSIKLKQKIRVDKAKLKRILVNLVENAIKFTKEGEVILGCHLVDKQLHFFVKDTGIGIPIKEHQSIFESFHKGKEAENKQHRGTGLGLTISKAFAELMKGEIHLESELNKGSTFTLQLPFIPVANDDQKTPSIPNLQDNTILIVEDEQMNYFLLFHAVSRTNATILWAKNGSEAIELLQQGDKEIDLILMDIIMPIMDGLEATRKIKILAPELPIIAQTACILAEDKKNILGAGCDSFLAKPLKKDKLFQLLEEHLITI